ncbi:MAG: hypothetical protein ACRDTU_00345 [Micromonosporaceae bacterium]
MSTMVVAESRQLSLFDADVVEVGPGDLAGLLAGPGQIVRLGGTARVSVVVAEQWRARTLLAEFAERGVTGSGSREPVEPAVPGESPDQREHSLPGPEGPHPGAGPAGEVAALDATDEPHPVAEEPHPGDGRAEDAVPDATAAPHLVAGELYLEPEGAVVGGGAVPGGAGTEMAAMEGHISVRTAFSTCLAPIASRWLHGAVTRPPDGFELNGPMLRLWYIAAGRVLGPPGGHSQAVVLGLSATDQTTWPAVVAALRRSGLPGAVLGPRGGGPAYRIVGRRRVARFAELIGTAPGTVPVGVWPVTTQRRPGAVSPARRSGISRTYGDSRTGNVKNSGG